MTADVLTHFMASIIPISLVHDEHDVGDELEGLRLEQLDEMFRDHRTGEKRDADGESACNYGWNCQRVSAEYGCGNSGE